MNILDKALADGVVDKTYHSRLLANLPRFAEIANIPESYALTSMAGTCTQAEIDWVKSVRKTSIGAGGAGLLYIGDVYPPVTERMMLITGALLRNYIDARMLAIKELVDKPEKFYSQPTVLSIPNFSIVKTRAVNWDTQLIMGVLMRRMAVNKYTILYAQSWESIQTDYGVQMVKFLENHYTVYEEHS